jgi:hypothetical protein
MFTATFLTSLLCVFNKKSYLCIAFRKTLGLKHRFPAMVLRALKARLGAKPRMVNGQWSMVNGQWSTVNEKAIGV